MLQIMHRDWLRPPSATGPDNLPRDKEPSTIAERLEAANVGFTEVLSADRILEASQARNPEKFTAFSFAHYDFEAPDLPVAAGPRNDSRVPLLRFSVSILATCLAALASTTNRSRPSSKTASP